MLVLFADGDDRHLLAAAGHIANPVGVAFPIRHDRPVITGAVEHVSEVMQHAALFLAAEVGSILITEFNEMASVEALARRVHFQGWSSFAPANDECEWIHNLVPSNPANSPFHLTNRGAKRRITCNVFATNEGV